MTRERTREVGLLITIFSELQGSRGNAVVNLFLVLVRKLAFIDVPINVLPLGKRDLFFDVWAVGHDQENGNETSK